MLPPSYNRVQLLRSSLLTVLHKRGSTDHRHQRLGRVKRLTDNDSSEGVVEIDDGLAMTSAEECSAWLV